MSFEKANPTEIGERLKIARESTKLTQSEVASELKMARTTLVAIEQGQRRARIDEVQSLARLYKTSVNAIFRDEAVHVDLIPRFRKLTNGVDAVENAANLLSSLVAAEVELENMLGIRRSQNPPPERPILPGDVRAQAEQDALELRQWFGLGSSPISDITSLLELEIGARVYIRRLDAKISGLYAYDSEVGACILLNANHPRERRSHTAAHELGHLVSTRRAPDIFTMGEIENSREERYANVFARSLLTPARALMQKFHEITSGATKITCRHIIILSYFFGVSREAIVRRLEELKLVKAGTWDWFEDNGSITDDQVREVLGDRLALDMSAADAGRPTSFRLSMLAEQAWKKGLLSEGQLARMLHIDRVELRRTFDELAAEGGELDGSMLHT